MSDSTILFLAGMITLVMLFGFLLVFMFRVTKLVLTAPFEDEEEEQTQVRAMRTPERPSNDFESFMRGGPWPDDDEEEKK